MMTKFKVGDKVCYIEKSGWFPVGLVLYVIEAEYDGHMDYLLSESINGNPSASSSLWVTAEEIELIEAKPSNSERITALESQVAELQEELQSLKKRKKPKYLLTHYPTPNEQRKAVIERAKAFVTEYSAEIRQHRLLAPRFFINPTKRTVVCLLDRYDLGYIHAKGIAKCAPDDVFNADIGKAIALGRALGLDVSEFVNAPKPTEVVVGSKVRYNSNYGKDEEYSVISINHDNFSITGGEFFWNYRLTDGSCDIIDDTEAQY